MVKLISTHSSRSGTGKSNITANLAVLVAKSGYRVGVLDTDIPSRGIHTLFQLKNVFPKSLNDFLWGRCKIEDAVFDVTERCIGSIQPDGERPRVLVIPSTLKIGEVARMVREGCEVKLLRDGLRELGRRLQLDFLFIDTHSGINEETLLPIALSDQLIVVMRPDQVEVEGTAISLELARHLEVPRLMMIINKIPPGMQPDSMKKQVQRLLNPDVVAMLPFSPELLKDGKGTMFCNSHPDDPWTQQLEQVAQQILRD